MSGVIDVNTVKMVFDNVLFQKNAQETLSTLDKLKEALNFEGAAKGLENLGNSVKNAGLDTLYDGVYKAQEGFNALEIVAARVLQNITDRIQGAVTQLANDALLQPLKDGFAEYELQMNSVQTIMASTGESIGTVNGYLDELNTYADKTIYSFSDMTQNIGKFTNAGVKLDSAVAAIQGISNVAAVSGANTNEASRAMYNFAQALSAGAVKLIDWKSIENANMATVEFKEQLIQTALAMGTLRQEGDKYVTTTTDMKGEVSEAFDATHAFNDSLSHQWMTTDVLVQTLEQYSKNIDEMSDAEKEEYRAKLMSIYGDEQKVESILELARKAASAAKDVKTFSQLIDTIKEALGSGWTKTWQLIFGDLNEAKRLWTDVNSVISGFVDKTSDARNSMLEIWHKSGYSYDKYGQLIKAFYNSEGKLVSKLPEDGKVFNKFGEEVEAVVDEETGELVPQLIENGKMIREEMSGRDYIINGLKNTYAVFAEAAKEFSTAWNKYFLGIDNSRISDISLTGEKLIDFSRNFYDATGSLKALWTTRDDQGRATESLNKLSQAFTIFAMSLRHGYDGIKDVFSGLRNIFKSFAQSEFFNVDNLKDLARSFSSVTSKIDNFGEAFNKQLGNDKLGLNLNALTHAWNALYTVLVSVFKLKIDIFTSAFDALGKVIEHLIEPFGSFARLIGLIGGRVSLFIDAFNDIFYSNDVSKFGEFFNSIAEGFNKFIDSLSKSVDFSGFDKFFDNLLGAMTSDKIDIFKGLSNVIEGLVNILKAFLAIATPVAAAFTNIFSGAISEVLLFIRELTDRFKSFTENLIANEEVISGIQHVAEGLFNIIKAIGEVLGNVILAVWNSLSEILAHFLPNSKELSDTLFDLGDKLNGVADVISSLVSGADGVPKLSDLIAGLTDRFIGFFGSLKDINLLEKLANLITRIGDGIKHALGGTEDMTLFDTIIEKLKGFLENLKKIFSDENGELDFIKIFEAGGIAVALKKLYDFIKDIRERTNDLKGIFGFIEDFKEILEGVADTFKNKLKAESIKAVSTAMLEIAGAMFILSMIDTAALAQAVVVMTAMFRMIERVLVILSSLKAAEVAAGAAAITAVGTAMLQLAGAIYIVGNMDPEAAVRGVVAAGVLLQGLVAATERLAKIENDIPAVAGAMIALALALDLLILPVRILGGMPLLDLAKGLGSVALMMTGLVAACVVLSKNVNGSSLKKTAFAILEMSVALRIIASAVKATAGLSWTDIAKGLVVMAAGLAAMIGAAELVKKGNLSADLLKLSAAMAVLGYAMTELAVASLMMHYVEWEDLGKMAAALAGGLVLLGAASWLINGKNLLMIAGAIALVATAFLELNAALGLSKLIGPLMTTISAAIEGMSHSLEKFAHTAATQAFIQFLKDAILFLPQLAVALIQSIAETVIALGEVITQVVAAFVKIGAEVLAGVAVLLPSLFNVVKIWIRESAKMIISEAPVIFQALGVFFDQLWQFLTGQLPNFFAFLTEFATQGLTFLQTICPQVHQTIFTCLSSLIQELMTFLQTNGPLVGETLLVLLQTLLTVIGTAVPQITGILVNLLLELLSQLAEFIPQMADYGIRIVLGFLQAIAAHIGEITEAGVTIAVEFIRGVAEQMDEIVDAAFKLIIGFIEGLATAIENNHEALFDAVGHLIKAIVEAILDGIGKIADAAGKWITGEDGNGGILGAVGGFFNDLFEAGANLVSGFIDGLLSMPGKLWDAACSIANDAWNAITHTLDEHSPSRLTFGGGRNFTLGFINGISDLANEAANASSGMAYGVVGAFNSAIGSGVNTYAPMVVPVFDDTNIKMGLNGIDSAHNISGQLTEQLTARIDDSVSGLNQFIRNAGDQLDAIQAKQDNLFTRVNYWLESIEGDTVEMVDIAKKGSNIYMDSGSLVGAIAPEMDQYLGRAAILTGRGV